MKVNRVVLIIVILLVGAVLAYAGSGSPFLESGYQALLYHSLMMEESFFELNPIALSLGEFEKAIREGKEVGEAHLMMGMIYRYLNRPGTALGHFLEFARIHPEQVWVNSVIGDLYFELGRNDHARQSYYKVVEGTDEKYAQAYFGLGNIAWEKGDFPNAKEAFEQAVACSRDYLDARLALGKTLYYMEDYEEAVAVLEIGLFQSAHFAPLQYYLGLSYEAVGKTEQAEHAWSRYHELTAP